MQQLQIKSKLTALAAILALAAPAAAMADSGCHLSKTGFQNAAMPAVYSGPAGGYGMVRVGYEKHHGGEKSGHSEQHMSKSNSIVDVAASAGNFQTLITAVKAAGLADTLAGDGPFTVFAPTDEAFAKLPRGTLEALLADKDKLTRILTYHVVPGQLDANAVGGMSTLSTVEGSKLPVAKLKIAKTDVMAGNGVIHVINEVLIPES